MIRSLRLRDFKSFRDVEVPLGPFTLVVGTNASGKSNLRDALRFLHGVGLGFTIAEIFGEKYGPGGILQWRGIRGGLPEAARVGSETSRIAFDVVTSVEHAQFGLAYGIELIPGHNATSPYLEQEYLKFEGADLSNAAMGFQVYGGNKDVWVLGSSANVFFALGPNKDFDFQIPLELRSHAPVLGQLPDVPESRPREIQETRTNVRALLSVFSSMRFLDLDPDAMRIPSNPGQTILGDRGENLSSVLQAICADPSRKTSLLEWVRALTPLDAADFSFESDFTGRILVHLVEAGGAKLSAASVSDGTLRFLAMVAALLSEDTGKIYVFEELDNGIHPTRLHLLLELIDRACAEQGVQVIATSHNPAMLAFLSERARADALLIYRGDDHTSHVRRVMDLPNIAEILRTQDLSRLMLSGWLEDAAAFSEPDPAPEASDEPSEEPA